MPKLEQVARRTEVVERIIAERLGLDLSQIIAGSVSVDVERGRERVTWRGLRDVEPGFFASVLAEADDEHG